MTRDKAYLIGTHKYSSKSGIPAEIIGVEFIKPEGDLNVRLCYHIQWADMVEDWIPISDNSNYKIVSFDDILQGNIL